MTDTAITSSSDHEHRGRIVRPAGAFVGTLASALACALAFVTAQPVRALSRALLGQQQEHGAQAPVVVQPGAPGQPTKTLPASTHATLLPPSKADVEFMQGMIMHHAQAVEMTALIPSHTENPELRTLGERISRSQSDEIRFMKRWLAARGQPTTMEMAGGMAGMPGMGGATDKSGKTMTMMMPGMLTPEQMEALRKARGAEFDRLFLTGMIQHHNGALIMVKDLYNTAGAGQDAEIFGFTTDVDTGQRAEIRIMQGMLDEKVGAGTTGTAKPDSATTDSGNKAHQ